MSDEGEIIYRGEIRYRTWEGLAGLGVLLVFEVVIGYMVWQVPAWDTFSRVIDCIFACALAILAIVICKLAWGFITDKRVWVRVTTRGIGRGEKWRAWEDLAMFGGQFSGYGVAMMAYSRGIVLCPISLGTVSHEEFARVSDEIRRRVVPRFGHEG